MSYTDALRKLYGITLFRSGRKDLRHIGHLMKVVKWHS